MLIFGLILARMAAGVKVAVYEKMPYVGVKGSMANAVLAAFERDLNEKIVIEGFVDEAAAVECVKDGKCDFAFGGYSKEMVASYPVLIDSIVDVRRDRRKLYVADIFWQFLVLMLTVWLPLMLILAHGLYLLEPSAKPYHLGVLDAMLHFFTLGNIKRPLGKLWALTSWIYLLFILLLITSDLSSIIASANISSHPSQSLYSCTSVPSIPNASLTSAETCLSLLKSSDTNHAILGFNELAYLYTSDLNHFIITPLHSTLIFYHVLLAPGASTSKYDNLLQSYWNKQVIPQIQAAYTHVEGKDGLRYSLVFEEFAVIFAGISVLAVFLVIFFIRNFVYKPTEKPNKDEKISEPSPTSRSLLHRNPSHTISLDNSLSNRYGTGRPEEWVNKAVDIQDDNAHRFKNIQDYENELSAVNPANPSLISDRSILSLIKSK